jgi:thiol-disulfide isomerase/thioredoxin
VPLARHLRFPKEENDVVYATVVIGLICLLNLALMLLIIRRLREMGDGHGGSQVPPEDVMTPHDGIAADFTATATTGEVVSLAGLSGITLVGFFSPSCMACKDRLPDFVEYAARMPGGRAQVLASMSSEGGAGTQMVAQLEPVARVVVESEMDPIFIAFNVRGFPAFCLIDETGRILSKADDVSRLAFPVAA